MIQVPDDFIVVLVTAKDPSEAEKISQTLLELRLIACANILSGVTSSFIWQGKTESATECLIVMKTKRSLFDELTKKVKALHSYEVPEVIALPIATGSEAYLAWLKDTLKT